MGRPTENIDGGAVNVDLLVGVNGEYKKIGDKNVCQSGTEYNPNRGSCSNI